MFAEFDWEPLAAASIGQTYRARLRTGEAVVVKIQRPGIDDVIERDLAALALLANVAQRRTTFGQGLRSGEMLAPVRRRACGPSSTSGARPTSWLEMTLLLGPDLGRAGAARPHRVLHAPPPRAGALRRVHRRRHRASSTRPASTGTRSPRSCCASTLEQVLRIGLFHADPHPGNIFAFRDGSLGLIDFGAVGRLDPIQQAAVVDILAAHRCGATSSLLRDGIERVAEVQNADRPEELERALARLLADHVRVTGVVEPSVLAGPRRHAGASSASASPPTSSCSRARWSPSTARSACSRPTSRSCPPPPSR